MYSKIAALAMLLAYAEARFGQEGLIQPLVSALGNFGEPGQAATLAGQTPGVLLAGANACAKLTLADTIVAQLGDDPAVIAAAAALVAAEKNFNPFAVSIPSICSDAALPATAALRGIIPLIDPAVEGSDVANAASAASLQNPLNADGLSVADVLIAAGFDNFTAQGSDGSNVDVAGQAGNAGNAGGDAAVDDNAAAGNNTGNAGNTNVACGAPVTLTKVVKAPAATATAAPVVEDDADAGADAGGAAGGVVNGVQQSTIAGLDFGLCVPTIKFQGGLGGRPATEFTFQAIDPLVALGQQEALNPNIITNRICDQLTNVCEANDAAKAACEDAQAQIQALGTRDADTANTWNTLLGFEGTDIDPQ